MATKVVTALPSLIDGVAAILGIGAGVAGTASIYGKPGSVPTPFEPGVRPGIGGTDIGSKFEAELEKHALEMVINDVKQALPKMISNKPDAIINVTGSVDSAIDALKGNKDIISDIIKISGGVSAIDSSSDIIDIIKSTAAKRKELLDAIGKVTVIGKPIFSLPGTNIRVGGEPKPTKPTEGTGTATVQPSDTTGRVGTGEGKIRVDTDPSLPVTTAGGDVRTGDGTGVRIETGPEAPPRPDVKVDPEDEPIPITDKKPKEPEDDDDRKKPDPEPPKVKPEEKPKIVERPISVQVKQPKLAPQQWYPRYQLGGQNLLKLTDAEKIEELRNYSLFDLVTPYLSGDQDNLLALQNQVQQTMRFSNTYESPRYPKPPTYVPPEADNWGHPMMDTRPTSYPMSLDSAHAQSYYDHWANDQPSHLNGRLDSMSRGGTFNPDLQKVLASRDRTGYGANDKIRKGDSNKFSLLEGIDSSSITYDDLMMLR